MIPNDLKHQYLFILMIVFFLLLLFENQLSLNYSIETFNRSVLYLALYDYMICCNKIYFLFNLIQR